MDLTTYAAALKKGKKYTDDSLAGVGAIEGKPCQIESITEITGGNRVTFLWVDNNGDSHTSTMDVMDGQNGQDGQDGQNGQDGQDGRGIKSMHINEQNHLIITYDDDTTEDAGEVPSGGGGGTSDYPQLSNKPQIEGHTLLGNMTLEDIGDVAMTDEAIINAVNTAFGL